MKLKASLALSASMAPFALGTAAPSHADAGCSKQMLDLFRTWSALVRTSNYPGRTHRSYLETVDYLDSKQVLLELKEEYPRYRDNLIAQSLPRTKESVTSYFYSFAQVLFPFHRDPIDNSPTSPERPDTVPLIAQVMNNLNYVLRSPDCSATWYNAYGTTPEEGYHDRSWFIVVTDHAAKLSLTLQASITD